MSTRNVTCNSSEASGGMDTFLGMLLLSGKEFGRLVYWCFVIGRPWVDATGYFTVEVCKQCAKESVWFLPPDYWKM